MLGAMKLLVMHYASAEVCVGLTCESLEKESKLSVVRPHIMVDKANSVATTVLHTL